MNRKALKSTAKTQVSAAGSSPKIITLIFLLSIAVLLALNVAVSQFTGGESQRHYLSDAISAGATNYILRFGVSLALQFVSVLLMAGYTQMALLLRRGETPAADVLLSGFRTAGRVILLDMLITLRVLLWSYVFCMPAAYLLVLSMLEEISLNQNAVLAAVYIYLLIVMFLASYRYRMAFFILMDHPELSASQALKQAISLNRGHRKELFVMDLSFLPWILLSLLTAGILFIWKLPYMVTTYANFYDVLEQDLARREEKVRQYMNQTPPPR